MPGKVQIIVGPAGSGKTERLLAEYRRSLGEGGLGGSLWISPTHRSAAEVRGRLLAADLPGCFSPAVMTFAQFAEQVLAASDEVVQPITDLIKRQVIRRLLQAEDAQQRLPYFHSIVHTSGLVDLVAEFISELKRHEIWPEDFAAACRQRGEQRKDQELSSLYAKYQAHLLNNELYDPEGRFWSARTLLREQKTRAFWNLRCAVFDGFTDFTRTQHELLGILVERGVTVNISLPGEVGDARTDLFAKSQRTLQTIERMNAGGKRQTLVTQLPRATQASWPALCHVETELFKSPRLVRAAQEAAGISVTVAARALDEIFQVGRRIKSLLVLGDPTDGSPVSAGDVVVVFRSLGSVARLVREAFDELGLPYVLDERPTLAETSVATILVALLRLHTEDWPFRRLVGLIAHRGWQPLGKSVTADEHLAAADRTIRHLQIALGRETLLSALRQRCERLAAGDREEYREALATSRQTLALLEQLAALLDRLPRRATLSEWARALAALAGDLGVLPSQAKAQADPQAAADLAVGEAIIETLMAAERGLTPANEAPRAIDGAEFLEFLEDIVRHEQAPGKEDETGRVRILSAASARALTIPYLFFAGLTEQAFPPPQRADRLYSEAEYERLAEGGLPLPLRAETSQEEMLLFYEVVTRAARQLHLSYPGFDDKGQALLPSPYLRELEHTCGASLVRRRVEDLSPVPRSETVACRSDERIAAVAQAVGAHRPSVDAPPAHRAGLLAAIAARTSERATCENILAGLQLTESRAVRDEFGPFEGIMTSPAVSGRLHQRFPDSAAWSASRLEQYRACPYQYFLSEILGLRAVDELTLADDHARRGSALHAILAQLHRELNAAHGKPTLPTAASGDFENLLNRLIDEHVAAPGAERQGHEAAQAEIDARLLRSWLDEYLEQHARYESQWRDFEAGLAPSHFEVSFGEEQGRGEAGSAPADSLSTPAPLVLLDGDRPIMIRGRIDRIDTGRVSGVPVFSVLDYKSSSASKHKLRAIEAGDALQVMLYTLAAAWLLERQGHLPWVAGYWFIADGGFSPKQALTVHQLADEKLLPTELWQELLHATIPRLRALVDSIRGGRFPVYSRDEHCTSYCDFRTVCRVNQARALEKSWEPQADQA